MQALQLLHVGQQPAGDDLLGVRLRLYQRSMRSVDMPNDPLVNSVLNALKGLRFGNAQLVVHEGEVVRIERLERIRVPSEPLEPPRRPEFPETQEKT